MGSHNFPGGTAATEARLAELDAANLPGDIDVLTETQFHETYIFPDNSALICTLTAGGTINTFGTWAEIADSASTTLSSKVTDNDGHITGIQIENMTEDRVYYLEVAYGEAKTNVLRHRFVKPTTKKAAVIGFIRIRSTEVPAGETIYYRMMCAQASQTCEVSFRYHYHS